MKISNTLPQYEDYPTLFVAIGSQHGVIYLAQEGGIERVEEISVDTPQYDENESFVKPIGGGGIYFGGFPTEHARDKAALEFSKRLAQSLETILQYSPADRIYLFIPPYMKEYLEKRWYDQVRDKIAGTYEGNYTNCSALELVRLAANKDTSKKGDASEATGDARHILEKFEHIRDVGGGHTMGK